MTRKGSRGRFARWWRDYDEQCRREEQIRTDEAVGRFHITDPRMAKAHCPMLIKSYAGTDGRGRLEQEEAT